MHLVGILFPHINDDARSKPHQNYNAFYGIHSGALIVTIHEYTNKRTMLQYKDFKVQTLEFGNVSPLSCGSSSGSVHQYLYKAEIINR